MKAENEAFSCLDMSYCSTFEVSRSFRAQRRDKKMQLAKAAGDFPIGPLVIDGLGASVQTEKQNTTYFF